MSEWKEYKLEDVCLKITDGSHFSPKVDPNGKRIIGTVKDMLDYSFNIENCKRINEEEYEKLLKNDCRPIHNDILFSKDGTIGKVIVFDFELDIVLLSSIAIIRPNTSLINPRFLAYILKSKKSQDEINENYKSGSAIPRVILRDFKRFPISIPDLPTQTAIAEILSSLDDKIELNNKINQELENLAQTLFKQWFIDFEFPNENGEPYKSSGGEIVESELGEIPKGWKVKTFADVVQVIDCLHSKKPIIFNESTGYLFLQLRNIKDNGLLDLTQKCWISKEDYQKWISRIEVKEGDFVITNVGRSGAVSRIGKGVKAAIGRNMTALRLKDNFQFNGFFSVLILSDFMKKEINSKLDSGTILDALNVKNIPKLRFTFPQKLELPIEFETIVRPIWDRMETNLIENNSLIDTRDYLLPKLISGELEVSQIQTAS